MKNNVLKPILFVILLFSFACEGKQGEVSRCDLAACDPGRKTLKQWVNEKGTIVFDQENQMYLVNVGKSPDIHIRGYACNLPEEFRTVGIQVLVSGHLKESCDEIPIRVAAQENYYLHITHIETVKD